MGPLLFEALLDLLLVAGRKETPPGQGEACLLMRLESSWHRVLATADLGSVEFILNYFWCTPLFVPHLVIKRQK